MNRHKIKDIFRDEALAVRERAQFTNYLLGPSRSLVIELGTRARLPPIKHRNGTKVP